MTNDDSDMKIAVELDVELLPSLLFEYVQLLQHDDDMKGL